ncbi:hypothetical protein [Pedobacter jamesrossensis]|uniref:Uncharacterized protein n=1 Tax=Pedobacter jamesrossensis TaxID=1908238 RepID=A0ABV8NKM8_9SPHI
MEEIAEVNKQKNSNLSVGLIALNIFLALILSTTVSKNDDPDGISIFFILAISGTILLGGYAFTYHGKGYRWAKWLFGILLVISLLLFALLWYAWQLGHAFKN